jgi:hypothetical protein
MYWTRLCCMIINGIINSQSITGQERKKEPENELIRFMPLCRCIADVRTVCCVRGGAGASIKNVENPTNSNAFLVYTPYTLWMMLQSCD